MSALSAAAVEIDALRGRLAGLAHVLRVLDRTITVADATLADVMITVGPVLAAAESAKATARPQIPAPGCATIGEPRAPIPGSIMRLGARETLPAPARPKDIVHTSAAKYARLDRVILQALRPGPMKATGLVDVTRCSPSQLKSSLKRLREKKLIALSGWTSKARWQLVPGVKILAPTAPSDRTAASGRSLNGVEFETVWDGTKDRTGQAPSLIGDRPTRSA